VDVDEFNKDRYGFPPLNFPPILTPSAYGKFPICEYLLPRRRWRGGPCLIRVELVVEVAAECRPGRDLGVFRTVAQKGSGQQMK
jgi:hypothetical protein